MTISEIERQAIKDVLRAGERFGYGNMISHLQTAWARRLVNRDNFSESGAREAAGGRGYPFKMQDDLIERGQWDETGESYR